MTDTVTLLFIGGYGRSGSTLVERIVGQLPGFFAVGELRHVWERGFLENQLCGCGRAFHSCEFWSAVGDEAFGGLGKVDMMRLLESKSSVDRLRYVPRHATAAALGRSSHKMTTRLAEYGATLEQLYRAIRDVSGASVIVDSSKDPSYAFVLNALPFADLRLLHLVRDSRAVAYSWSRSKIRPEVAGRRALMPRFSAIRSSLEWDAYNYSIGLLVKLVELSALLRYEDFVRDPAPITKRILAELGLGAAHDLSFIDGRRASLETNHTVSGNPIRFRDGLVDLVPDEEWQTEIKNSTRRLVTGLTLDLLWRYGYLGARP